MHRLMSLRTQLLLLVGVPLLLLLVFEFELVYEEVQQLMVASTMDEGHWEPHLYNWFQYFVPVESE